MIERVIHSTANRRRRRRVVWLLLAVCVIAIAYYVWHKPTKKDESHKRPQAPVTVAPVTKRDVPVYLNALGTIQANNAVTIRTQVDGQLMTINFREGQDVKAGDVLAQIDPRTYQAQYDQAVANKSKDEAQLANARLDLKRYANLGNSIARQTLDTQRATVKQLEAAVMADQAAVTSANTQLGFTKIVAPIPGRTGIRQVDKGNIVHPGDTNGIVVLIQLTPISVLFSLPQQDFTAINEQMMLGKLAIDTLAADNKTVTDSGMLDLIDNQVDQTTGTIRLKATLPNAKRMLWPGAFTNVRLKLTTRLGVLTVPTVAVQHGPQGSYVFAYRRAEGTVAIKPVTVSMTEGQDSVIDQGLVEGEEVITDGMAKLQDGSHVSVAEAKPVEKPTNVAVPSPHATVEPTTTTPDSSKGKKHRHAQEQ